MDALHWWRQGDAVTQATALALLAMSVASWVVALYKLALLRRARADVARCTAAFWQAPTLALAAERLRAMDRSGLLQPMVEAAARLAPDPGAPGAEAGPPRASLAEAGSLSQQLTRALRDALQHGVGRLQSGQVLLATVGSTAPFVGLLGTVWGIYHALTALSGGGPVHMAQLAGPVGEALVMTAAGLAVALPAVLAYNVLGRHIGQVEAELEGFAHDVRSLVLDTAGRGEPGLPARP